MPNSRASQPPLVVWVALAAALLLRVSCPPVVEYLGPGTYSVTLPEGDAADLDAREPGVPPGAGYASDASP